MRVPGLDGRRLCLNLRRLPAAIAAASAVVGIVCLPVTARAQAVYVYNPPPPPPPPPPPNYYYGPGYGYGPRYYYVYREPPYAFDLGVDLEGAIPLNVPQLGGAQWTGGGGLKIRAGEQIRLQGGLRLTPEVGYGFDRLFVRDDAGNEFDWSMNRLFAGARLGIGRYVVPAVYAHVGYGWQETGDPSARGNNGFAFDVGGALDFHVVPHFVFGAHLEYAAVDVQPDQVSWLALGVHGDFLF